MFILVLGWVIAIASWFIFIAVMVDLSRHSRRERQRVREGHAATSKAAPDEVPIGR